MAKLANGGRKVRNSNDPEGPVVGFTEGEWDKFVLGVKNGEFD